MAHPINRRRFSQTLAAGLAAVTRPLQAAARLNIGIGAFTYHNLSIDAMIVQLQALGIREIEMSRGEFMLFARPTEAMCREARRKFDQAGIRCVSYYTATLKQDQDIENAVRFATLLGARHVSGDATGVMLQKIDRRFTREGLTFGIHNHWFKQKFAFESAEDVLQALEGRSPTMGATLDVGQMAACGHDPVEAVRKLFPRLKLVHLKDVEAAGAEHNVLLGKGIVNIPAVMAELKRRAFRGLVAIEYESERPVEEDVRIQVEYARKLA